MDDQVVGFCELDPDRHSEVTYVHPYARMGVASQLVGYAFAAAAARGLKRVHVGTSIHAKPLFEKLRFMIIDEQIVHIRGVGLQKVRMEKKI